jgi:hypothetical protein
VLLEKSDVWRGTQQPPVAARADGKVKRLRHPGETHKERESRKRKTMSKAARATSLRPDTGACLPSNAYPLTVVRGWGSCEPCYH